MLKIKQWDIEGCTYLCTNILIILFIYFRKIKITNKGGGEGGGVAHLELVKVNIHSSLHGIIYGCFKNVGKILNN